MRTRKEIQERIEKLELHIEKLKEVESNWGILNQPDVNYCQVEINALHWVLRGSAETDLSIFEKSDFIHNVCLSRRHDFGLMSEDKRKVLIFECKEWLRAIKNNLNIK